MSGAASLTGSSINLAALREQTVGDLATLLDLKGKKALVLDPTLSGPLSLVAKTTFMKEHEVEKIYLLGPRLETASKVRAANGRAVVFPRTVSVWWQTVIYLVRPTMEAMQQVAAHIHQHSEKGQKKEYDVVFVPRRTMVAERVLEDRGVYAHLMSCVFIRPTSCLGAQKRSLIWCLLAPSLVHSLLAVSLRLTLSAQVRGRDDSRAAHGPGGAGHGRADARAGFVLL
jgi:hypothetical protein